MWIAIILLGTHRKDNAYINDVVYWKRQYACCFYSLMTDVLVQLAGTSIIPRNIKLLDIRCVNYFVIFKSL